MQLLFISFAVFVATQVSAREPIVDFGEDLEGRAGREAFNAETLRLFSAMSSLRNLEKIVRLPFRLIGIEKAAETEGRELLTVLKRARIDAPLLEAAALTSFKRYSPTNVAAIAALFPRLSPACQHRFIKRCEDRDLDTLLVEDLERKAGWYPAIATVMHDL